MSRYAKLLYRFTAVSFRNFSEFRIDFFTAILHNLLYQAIFIVFWKTVVSYTDGALGEWTFSELAVLSAFTLVATALMQWFMGLLTLSSKVLRGDLDKYLCRPVSPLFALLAEETNALVSIQQMASALLLLGAICYHYGISLTLAGVVASTFVVLLGCSVVVLIQGCLGLLSFWFGDVSRINALFMISGEFERYPIDLFPGWLRGFLIYILPIGLISTYPVLIFLGRVELAPLFVAIALGLLAVWALIFSRLWQAAVLRYESFGG